CSGIKHGFNPRAKLLISSANNQYIRRRHRLSNGLINPEEGSSPACSTIDEDGTAAIELKSFSKLLNLSHRRRPEAGTQRHRNSLDSPRWNTGGGQRL